MSIPQQPGYGPAQPFPNPPPDPPGKRVPWPVVMIVGVLAVAALVTMTLYATGVVGAAAPKIEKPDSAKNVPPNPYQDPEATPYGYVDDLCERLDWGPLAEILEFSTEDVVAEYTPDLHSAAMKCRVDGDDTDAGDVGVHFSVATYTKRESAAEMYQYTDVSPDEKDAEPLPDYDGVAIKIGPAATEGRTAVRYSVLNGNVTMFGAAQFMDDEAEAGAQAVRDAIDAILTLSKEA